MMHSFSAGLRAQAESGLCLSTCNNGSNQQGCPVPCCHPRHMHAQQALASVTAVWLQTRLTIAAWDYAGCGELRLISPR